MVEGGGRTAARRAEVQFDDVRVDVAVVEVAAAEIDEICDLQQ